ncbi:choline sulfate utilization transcriptional regulator [Azospirillum sp. ST 5-10]|uniref:choline sulfate utilization transcriptional regulator n=1 Tax=unclassified Azospirillum TaxID=2630922 RepID=UPI003F4A1620
MVNRRAWLQPLAFFEAAGRHLNFSAAARELGVTQSAVSHQVGWLEADLGVALFRRLHRGVALTVEGARLFDVVRRGLDDIDRVMSELRVGRNKRVMTVATDFGFAAWWLVPRLPRLRERMPDLDVRILTTQEMVDVRREPIDVAIGFGAGAWPGCRAWPLFPEIVVPICSPGFRDRLAARPGVAELAALPLLHVDSPGTAVWLSWADWFDLHGIGRRRAGGLDLSFNNYPLVLQAAMMGQGVALGWVPLIDTLLEGGQLVTLADRIVRSAYGYFLVEADSGGGSGGRGNLEVFRTWIRAEAASAA